MSKNTPVVQPYLFFNGRCEEAVEYYKKHLGAHQEMLMRYKDSPEPPPAGNCPPDMGNKVMHASLHIGNTNVMMSDGQCDPKTRFEGFALSLGVDNEAEAEALFKPLADGGQVVMPLGKTFFSPRFGMVKDRFGVMWMVIVQTPV